MCARAFKFRVLICFLKYQTEFSSNLWRVSALRFHAAPQHVSSHQHERWGAHQRKEIAARQCDPGRQVFAAGHLQIAFQFQSATFDTHTGLSSSLVSRTALGAYFLPHWSRDFKSIISSGFKKKRKSQIVMRDMCSFSTFLGARSDMRTFYTWCAREGKIYKYLSYEHTHGRRARASILCSSLYPLLRFNKVVKTKERIFTTKFKLYDRIFSFFRLIFRLRI